MGLSNDYPCQKSPVSSFFNDLAISMKWSFIHFDPEFASHLRWKDN